VSLDDLQTPTALVGGAELRAAGACLSDIETFAAVGDPDIDARVALAR